MDLTDRTILLTGANRGIGRAVARRLAREPVRLLAGVRDLERFEPPAGAAEVTPVHVDLSTAESIEASVAGLDRVDVLINNAGDLVGGPLAETDVEAIYRVIQVNLAGSLHLTRRLLPQMLERGEGKIVNQSSVIAYAHFPGTAVYAATKAGIAAMTAALRRELDGTGVTTLELITGGTDTDMLRGAADDMDDHTDPSNWEFRDPDDWADKIVEAIEKDKDRLEPLGKSRLLRLAGVAPPAVMDQIAKRAWD
jgi:short-subunit dehydrogenase